MKRFEAWMREREQEARPADPARVAEYLGEVAAGDGYERAPSLSSLRRIRAAIDHAHIGTGFPPPSDDPGVRSAWARIMRERSGEPHRDVVRVLDEVFAPDLQHMVLAQPQTPLGWRDRLLLSVAAGAYLKTAETLALTLADVVEVEQGISVALPEGGEATLQAYSYALDLREPLYRWRAFLRAHLGGADEFDSARLDASPLFLSVDRHGRVSDRAISDVGLTKTVRRAAELAGLEGPSRFSAGMLRDLARPPGEQQR
jgi:hypothetical protein